MPKHDIEEPNEMGYCKAPAPLGSLRGVCPKAKLPTVKTLQFKLQLQIDVAFSTIGQNRKLQKKLKEA